MERHGRSIGEVEATPGTPTLAGATPFQTTMSRPSKALASAAQRAPTVPEALAGAAIPSTSADASSNAMRDLVDTVLPPSLSCG